MLSPPRRWQRAQDLLRQSADDPSEAEAEMVDPNGRNAADDAAALLVEDVDLTGTLEPVRRIERDPTATAIAGAARPVDDRRQLGADGRRLNKWDKSGLHDNSVLSDVDETQVDRYCVPIRTYLVNTLSRFFWTLYQ